ncbi:MAG: CAP domain-containing protein [Rhodobacteraceae bacterium]|nr:CAP domain-containing protein [Paracoccaceae bacterium]
MAFLRMMSLAVGMALVASTSEAGCARPEGGAGEVAALADAINRYRADRGLQPLAVTPALSRAAGDHACAMVAQNRFSHDLGGSPKTRMRKAGCRTRLAGENIAMGYARGADVLRQWLDSPGHRRVLSMRGISRMGIAVASPKPGQGGGPRWVLDVAAGC